MRRLRGNQVQARTILRKKKKAGYTGETNIPEMDAISNLKDSYAEYRVVLKDCEERRNTFLNDLAIAKAKSGNVKIANVLKQIQ